MRLAVIADIHGNVLALEAVLKDVATRRVDMTIDLGDCVSGPLWPRETFELLDKLKLPTVRGNHDRALGAPRSLTPAPDSWETFAQAELPTVAFQALANLPAVLRPLPGVLAFHASPDDDNTYFLEDIVDGELRLASNTAINERVGATVADLLLCGHSHLPQVVQVGPRLIVNPGSVGCPAYTDPTPPRHVSEAASPHARYAILDNSAGPWHADLIAITYDWTRAAARARKNNWPRWATALETGRVG